jgi:hypothetical protein
VLSQPPSGTPILRHLSGAASKPYYYYGKQWL